MRSGLIRVNGVVLGWREGRFTVIYAVGLCVLCSGGGRLCPRSSCVELQCANSLDGYVTLAGFDSVVLLCLCS